MDAELLRRRADFLDNASHLFLASNPALTAHLVGSRQRLEERHDVPSTAREHLPSCTACGNILIAGWSSDVVTKDGRRKWTRQDRLAGKSGTKVFRCLRCSSKTEVSQAKKLRKPDTFEAEAGVSRLKPVKKTSVDTKDPLPVSNDKPPQPESTGAKKRTRNKKSSLRDMLANRKLTNPAGGGFGFDLLDFTKT